MHVLKFWWVRKIKDSSSWENWVSKILQQFYFTPYFCLLLAEVLCFYSIFHEGVGFLVFAQDEACHFIIYLQNKLYNFASGGHVLFRERGDEE